MRRLSSQLKQLHPLLARRLCAQQGQMSTQPLYSAQEQQGGYYEDLPQQDQNQAQNFRQGPYPAQPNSSGPHLQGQQASQTQYGQPNPGYAQPQQYPPPQQQNMYPQQAAPYPPHNPFLDQDPNQAQGYQQNYYPGNMQQGFQQANTGLDPNGQVEPPQIVAWSKDHLNSTRVIGVVAAQPTVRYMQNGNMVANVRLGVATPGKKENRQTSWMDVELWDKQAMQVERYIQKGMKLAVGGHIKQSSWINAETQKENTKLQIKADYFQLVEPYGSPQGQAPLAGFAQGNFPSPPAYGQQYSQAGPVGQRQPTQTSGPSPQDLDTYNAWRGSPGVNFIDAAQQLNKTPETVLDNIMKAILSDKADMTEADALRLASQLEIGPRDSPFMDLETVNKAMDEALAEETTRDPETSVNGLRLKPILERLQASTLPRSNGLPSIRDIIETRHQAFGKLGVSLSYAQLRFAKALKVKGMEINVHQQPEDIRSSYQHFTAGQFAHSPQ